MKKRHVISGLLLVTVAALAFTACGKKKDSKTTGNKTTTSAKTTTKANTTTKKQENIKLNNYFSKVDSGIIAMDVQTKDNKLTYIALLSMANEGYPMLIEPVFESGEIKKIKFSAFLGGDEAAVYYIRTLDVKEDGIQLPTSLRCKANETYESEALFFRNKDGKLNIYNRYTSILVDEAGTVTSNDLEAASSTPKALGDYKISYTNGIYSLVMQTVQNDKMNISLNPSDLKVEMQYYNNYFNKYLTYGRYTMDMTSSNPIATVWADPTMMNMGSEDADIFNEPNVINVGYAKPTLDANGNVTKCELKMEAFGMVMEEMVANFTYDSNNNIDKISFEYEDEGKLIKSYYKYTYDQKGRVRTFIDGIVKEDGDDEIELNKIERTYSYTDYGYMSTILERIMEYNDSNVKTKDEKYEYSFQFNDNYYMTQFTKKQDKGSGYSELWHSTQTYDESGLVTSYINITANDSNNYKREYTYTNGTLTKEDYYFNYGLDNQYKTYSIEYSSGVDTNNYYYRTNTRTDYSMDGNETGTETITYKYLDENHLFIKSYAREYASISSTPKTSYDRTTYEYAESKGNLILSIVKEKKETTQTEAQKTVKEKQYVYKPTTWAIDYTLETVTYAGEEDESEKVETKYNEAGYVTEIYNGVNYSLSKYYYDEDMNLEKVETCQYCDLTGIKDYLPVQAMLFETGNPFLPVGMEMYNYSTSYELLSKLTYYYYTLDMNNPADSTIKKQITESGYTDGKALYKQEKTYYDNKNNTIQQEETYQYEIASSTTLNLKQYNKTIYRDGDTAVKSEAQVFTYTYEGTNVTIAGTRFTYDEDGTTMTGSYTWNVETQSWDRDVA